MTNLHKPRTSGKHCKAILRRLIEGRESGRLSEEQGDELFNSALRVMPRKMLDRLFTEMMLLVPPEKANHIVQDAIAKLKARRPKASKALDVVR